MACLVVITPNPGLFPPQGGGMIRRFHLIKELARNHEVHAIVSQPQYELRQPIDGYKFPSSVQVHSIGDFPSPIVSSTKLIARLGLAFQYRWIRRSWSGPTDSGVVNSYPIIRKILRQHKVDAVIFG